VHFVVVYVRCVLYVLQIVVVVILMISPLAGCVVAFVVVFEKGEC